MVRYGITLALLLSVCGLAMGAPLTLEQVRSHRMLLEAIVKNDIDAARKALDGGADPNRIIGEYSPLETAALTGEITIVKLLVECGADPATKKKDGTPVHEWATRFGGDDPDSPLKQIGAYLKAKIAGAPDPVITKPDAAKSDAPRAEAPQPTEEDLANAKLDDGVVVMPETALKAAAVEKADLSAFNNVAVPQGWKVFRAEKEKAWILSNGLDDDRAVRFIVADPTDAPESLNLVRQDLESGLRGYANLCGVPAGKEFGLSTVIITHADRTLSVSADGMGMEKNKVVGQFELDGKIQGGKLYAVLMHRGRAEETLKAITMFSDFKTVALRSR